MRMIKIAVCDDEPIMAQELSGHLSRYMSERQITSYSVSVFPDGRSLLVGGCDFDVIFLDIQMEPPNGMETARILREQNPYCLLIFVTVLREYVFDAFAVEAYDYLTKPLDPSRLQRTMDRVLRTLSQRTAKDLVIRRGAVCRVIPLSQILYCEVQGRKIYIHLTDGSVVDHCEKLADLEQRVDGRFFRCHRSYLVNLEYVRGCGAGQITLPQSGSIPVSRLREHDLTQALLRHMRERRC